MEQNIKQLAQTDSAKQIAERLNERLHMHAGNLGIHITPALEEGLKTFIIEVASEEIEESEYDISYNGLTADVLELLAMAADRIVKDIRSGTF